MSAFINRVFESTDIDILIEPCPGDIGIFSESIGAVDRNITFEVYGKNAIGNSENAAVVVASNTIPASLSNVNQTLVSDTGTEKTYRLSWDPSLATDLKVFRVWGSTTQGFTPDVSNQIWQGLALETNVTVSSGPGITITQAPDIYKTTTASSTTEFFNGDTEADPSPASSYWTCSVGDPQTTGFHFCEWELRGEITEASNDAEAAMVGVVNENATLPHTTGYFGSNANHWGVYMQNGQIYNGGGTGVFLKNPDGSTWTAANLGDKVSVLMDADTGKCYIYRSNGVTAGFCRNPDNSIPDPATGANPNFTYTGTSGQITMGDAQTTRDMRAIVIPAASRVVPTLVASGDLYWRVAAVDVWESDDDVFNYSAEQTLTS